MHLLHGRLHSGKATNQVQNLITHSMTPEIRPQAYCGLGVIKSTTLWLCSPGTMLSTTVSSHNTNEKTRKKSREKKNSFTLKNDRNWTNF